jgi:hypothetical protein
MTLVDDEVFDIGLVDTEQRSAGVCGCCGGIGAARQAGVSGGGAGISRRTEHGPS